jgi:flagellar hook-associated protein 3 FlgL
MRITDRSMLQNSLRDIKTGQERLHKTQGQATSGIKVGRPSDDPVAYAQIGSRDEMLARLDGYNRNISVVRGRLSSMETNLTGVVGMLNRLRELTLVSLNVATVTESAATEAEVLYQQLTGTVNQTYAGEYLFSGYNAGAPFSGSRFVGDNQKRAIEISPLGATAFGVSAQEAFGVAPGQDVFKSISDLVAAMRAGNRAGIAAGLDAVDQQLTITANALTSLGGQQNTLTLAEEANKQYAFELQKAQRAQRDIDPAEAYSRLAADQHALQATFAVLGSSSRLSLIKYL